MEWFSDRSAAPRSRDTPSRFLVEHPPRSPPRDAPWRALRCCVPSALLKPHQLVDTVECGYLVTLRQSRIVEHRLHEVIDSAFQNHHRLADVQQFGGPFADDVHAQNLARLPMEDPVYYT